MASSTVSADTNDPVSIIATECEGLAIHLRFLTDRCVATSVNDRDRAEWPPHPGRVFMALVAAYFETDGSADDKAAERAALEWLECLPAPRIQSVRGDERSPVTFYVPVNDAPKPNKAMLQSAPGMPRSRQSRSFPTVIPRRDATTADTQPDVSLVWPVADGLAAHQQAIERLCGNVIRVGHSSSLVMAWAGFAESTDLEDHEDTDAATLEWEPTDTLAEISCRVVSSGELERLRQACRADRIELFAQLKDEIDSTKGKTKKAAKARFEEYFGEAYKTSLRPPEPTPPSLGLWQGYRCTANPDEKPPHVNTYFERDLIILAKHDGPMLSVERTLHLTRALRQAALSCSGESQVPAWLSGHDPDQSPTSEPHAAFLALPFAGYEHADGHLMGLAIALPRGVPAEERGRWLGPLLVDQQTGEVSSRTIRLWARDFPDWSVQLEDRPSPPLTLQNSTWTKPSTTWASVTPVVLDRFPKSSRSGDRVAWHREVQDIIATSCQRAGLPEPMQIDVDSTCWHTGVPRAWTKRRRSQNNDGANVTASELGDGFQSLPAKASRPAKPQVHVWIRFDRPVSGPVILGAGRFQGYGLCKPLANPAPQREIAR